MLDESKNPQQFPARLDIQTPAASDQVKWIRAQVASFSRGLAFTPEEVEAVTLAVGEACNNAVMYGARGTDAPVVTVSCRLAAPDRLQIEVKNQGNSFHPDLDSQAKPPDALATHGRGIPLMLALMDDVQVLSEGGDTVVRLTKQRRPKIGAA